MQRGASIGPLGLWATIVIGALGLRATNSPAQRPGSVPLRSGLILTSSARISPNEYRIAAPTGGDSAVLVIRGDDMTVDFQGATLIGSSGLPDQRSGTAILVDGGHNVTIRNARIHGYKVAIRARGTRNLKLLDSDLSDNWKPRLFSLVEHESLVDWLSFHHNEHNEWLRFGAAMYLENVHGGEVRGTVVEGGMNGLLLVRSDSVMVWNNDFSFDSGLGIGLYRSSDNRLMHNRVDYDVRGYSEGFYHRGQDSAGILLYEQSCRNVIAFNSVTHGGDGLFLWAGQSTMDTGQGGANENLVFANDFSFAPANGIEATFSRNTFVQNIVRGSDYGIWGGYSFDTWVLGNVLFLNRFGVAIEHGQANRIERNVIVMDSIAVRLWADTIEPSDWGYPKHRDTRSRDNFISENVIAQARVGVLAANSGTLTVRDNTFASVDSDVVATNTNIVRHDTTVNEQGAGLTAEIPPELQARLPARLPNAQQTSSALASLLRSAIVVDEWGPYDWRSPKLWPLDSVRSTPLRLAVLGPPGTWVVRYTRGIGALSKRKGRIPAIGRVDTIAVTPEAGSSGDWSLGLEHRADSGHVVRQFNYDQFEPSIRWVERIFRWTDESDPRVHPDRFAALLRGAPLLERTAPRLDVMWYRPSVASIPMTNWTLDATGEVNLPRGRYTVQTISDDAVRVWVDDQLVIDHWQPHESEVDEAPLGGGRHHLHVQYVQVEGWAELRVDIHRGPPTGSRGTPGPH